ncbi:MAG TPA: terminase gpA endonuclease subunit, partial [Verrucomicrobiae bacterium]|nr:terminase gpA endonuclease subunit [Verrucomicrobiae bacterium]
MNPFINAARIAWKPQDLRTPWEWCEDHVIVDKTSPLPGKWRSANSPWVKEVMEIRLDRRVRICCVKCSAQSSKTQTVLNLLMYDIVEDSGPTMYVMANKEDAADFVDDRFLPTLMNCKPAAELLRGQKGLGFKFKNGMPLYFVGAGSMAKLQGKPMKRLMLDEVRNYPDGALETVLKRVRAFGDLSQIFMISTPDKKGDTMDRSFLDGDQRTFHFPCPMCAHMQQLRMAQLKWDTNEETKPEGRYNFDRLALTIRYECEQCGHQIKDTPAERKMICRAGRFIRMNPNAPVHHVSFTWNALLPWWVSWRSIAEEFLNARAAARNQDLNSLKTFINETLGESWEDSLGVIEDFGFLEARKDAYDYGEGFAEAHRRLMAADKQEKGGEHYWWVVREFAAFGKSRLIAHGRASTLAELEELRVKYQVAKGDAVIDSGYEAQQVYRFCISTGWRAFKGDQVDFYLVQKQDPRNSEKVVTVRQMYRKTQAMVYNPDTKRRIGPIPLYTFAGAPTTDLLMEFMSGLVGEWTIPHGVDREYLKQMTGERREQKEDGRGAIHYFWKRVGANHYLDCERMIMIAAIVSKTIAPPRPVV